MTDSGRQPFPYQKIVDDLRLAIDNGQLPPGERLESEYDLAARYGTSRPTVRRAIALLKAEGLVVTEQGRGAFVRPKSHVRLLLTGTSFQKHRQAGLSGFNAQVIEQGQRPEQRLLAVERIEAPDEIALRLDLDPGSPLIVRRRLFLVEDRPIAFCDSYYPATLAEGTPLAEWRKIRGGAYAVIEDENGPIRRQIAHSVDELVGRMPTHEEMETLKLKQGVPVIRICKTVYDVEDLPLEVQVTVAASDCHEIRYEVPMR
ncbi:MAG: GntR family transcriptional regulator [Candidatus Dormibacteraceae bacterium]